MVCKFQNCFYGGQKPVNGRISYINFKNKQTEITIMNAYTPTEEGIEEDKTVFHYKLEEDCENLPQRHI